MTNDQTSSERVGTFAAGVLESLYAVVYGEPPGGGRAWTEGGALMLLLRLAGPAPFGGYQPDQPDLPGMLPYGAIPELVAAAVRVQIGCELGIGSFSVEAELGLAMFVFRLPFEPPSAWHLPERGEWLPELTPEWSSAGVPPWSEVASIGGSGDVGEREHLRLVADDRGPGQIPR
jgi:hypothetical protein